MEELVCGLKEEVDYLTLQEEYQVQARSGGLVVRYKEQIHRQGRRDCSGKRTRQHAIDVSREAGSGILDTRARGGRLKDRLS